MQTQLLVSAILTCHREGALLQPSLRALAHALRHFDPTAANWEILCVVDRGNEATMEALRSVMRSLGDLPIRCHVVSFGDLGLSRNEGVALAKGEYVLFCDADDLVSENWVSESVRRAAEHPDRIYHPELSLYFGERTAVMAHPRQTKYDIRALLFHNLWTALSFAARKTFLEVPYQKNEISRGFGYEDWYWHCTTISQGFIHDVIPSTCHFVRTKPADEALSLKTAQNCCVIRRSDVWRKVFTAPRVSQEGVDTSEIFFDAPRLSGEIYELPLTELPAWATPLIQSAQQIEPAIQFNGALANYSAPQKPTYVETLPPAMVLALHHGLHAVHFFDSERSIPASLRQHADHANLFFVQHLTDLQPSAPNIVSLSQLERDVGSRFYTLLANFIIQSGAAELHLWDCAAALELCKRYLRSLKGSKTTVVWHQLIPYSTPPAFLMRGKRLIACGRIESGSHSFPQPILTTAQRSILFLVDIPTEASPWSHQSVWYRVFGPLDAIIRLGHRGSVLLAGDQARVRQALEHEDIDAVILHRGIYNGNFAAIREMTARKKIPLIYDLDDNIIDPEKLLSATHTASVDSAQRQKLQEWALANQTALAACDGALLASKDLQQLALLHNNASHYFPNFIPDFYMSEHYEPGDNAASQPITLYYGPGSTEHAIHFDIVAETIAKLFNDYPSLRLALGGGLPIPDCLAKFHHRITSIPRLAPQQYMTSLAHMDIVLAPLKLDGFSVCKSWIKALEASACGVPWIGSALPSFHEYVKETGTGIIVSENDWETTLRHVIDDLPSYRDRARKMAMAIRNAYCARAHAQQFLLTVETIRQRTFAPERMKGSPLSLVDDDSLYGEDSHRGQEGESTEHAHAQLYWAVTKNFTEAQSITLDFPLNHWQTLSFDLPPVEVLHLRFDPATFAGKGLLRRIAFVPHGAHDKGWSLEGDALHSAITLVGARKEALAEGIVHFSTLGNDPQCHLPHCATTPYGGKLIVECCYSLTAEPASMTFWARARRKALRWVNH